MKSMSIHNIAFEEVLIEGDSRHQGEGVRSQSGCRVEGFSQECGTRRVEGMKIESSVLEKPLGHLNETLESP